MPNKVHNLITQIALGYRAGVVSGEQINKLKEALGYRSDLFFKIFINKLRTESAWTAIVSTGKQVYAT